MEELWAGRFQKAQDKTTEAFNSSIAVDSRMAREDILGSLAHAAMLREQGIISEADGKAIEQGLTGIAEDLQSGALAVDTQAEDIHTFIEKTLTARIGDAGKRLHTGRSRNDQVALDFKLYLKNRIPEIQSRIVRLITVLCDTAETYAGAIMPGYTHLQRAQPVTFGHHLMAYAQMFLRDLGRLRDAGRRMDACPLGSGALAGTTYPLNREATAKALGFSEITQNSMDAVSDRDFAVELTAALALVMVHLSRFSEEIVLWSSWEFKFIELDDAFATGSSIMPQKKNPDIAELVRGKSGRVFGDLITLLTVLKGLPLAYNKDMQEDKEAVFDALDTVSDCLDAFTPMVQTATVRTDNMRKAAAGGFINATDCADYLTRKGVPFRDAYRAVGQLVAECAKKGCTLETLPIEDYRAVCGAFSSDVYKSIRLERCANGRNVPGGPAPDRVKEQIAGVRRAVRAWEEEKS